MLFPRRFFRRTTLLTLQDLSLCAVPPQSCWVPCGWCVLPILPFFLYSIRCQLNVTTSPWYLRFVTCSLTISTSIRLNTLISVVSLVLHCVGSGLVSTGYTLLYSICLPYGKYNLNQRYKDLLERPSGERERERDFEQEHTGAQVKQDPQYSRGMYMVLHDLFP
jgi:hypothetical protein